MEQGSDDLRDTLRVQRSIIKHYRGQCRRLEQLVKPDCYKAWWEQAELANEELVERLQEKDANMVLLLDKLRACEIQLREHDNDLAWAIEWISRVLDKLKERRSET